MQISRCARTRRRFQWNSGRTASSDFSDRKARSTRARLLYARTVSGVPQLLLLQARADHVDPVQTLLRPDRLLLAPGAERLRLLVERPLEVLAHAPPLGPPPAGCSRPAARSLGYSWQVTLARSGVSNSPGWITLRFTSLRRVSPAQGGDPVEASWLEVGVDAGLGDHAAVADQGHALQAEALAQDLHASSEGVRVGGVAGEGLDGDGAALGAAQQAVDDLGAVGAVVAGVAAGGKLAAGALEVAGGDVVQGEGAGGEVAFGELALNGGLAQGEPVHGVVEVVGGGVAEVEQGGQGGAAGGAEFALDAQLGAGAEQAGDDHGEGEGALAAGPGEEQGVEWEAAGQCRARR